MGTGYQALIQAVGRVKECSLTTKEFRLLNTQKSLGGYSFEGEVIFKFEIIKRDQNSKIICSLSDNMKYKYFKSHLRNFRKRTIMKGEVETKSFRDQYQSSLKDMRSAIGGANYQGISGFQNLNYNMSFKGTGYGNGEKVVEPRIQQRQVFNYSHKKPIEEPQIIQNERK